MTKGIVLSSLSRSLIKRLTRELVLNYQSLYILENNVRTLFDCSFKEMNNAKSIVRSKR